MMDRAMIGGLSGIIASIFCTLYEVILERLKFTDRSFLDYTASLVSNNVYPGTLGFIVGFSSQAAVGLIFGMLFMYITKIITSRYYLLKGLGYGFTLWLILTGFGVILKLPTTRDIPPTVSLFDLTNALLFGFTTAYVSKVLSRKFTILDN